MPGIKNMKLVYLASAYSIGNKLHNVNRQIDVADRLMRAGFCPVVPLYSHYHHKRHPHNYEQWIALDMAKLRRCDAVLRLPGRSPGADREVQQAKLWFIPVFTSMKELKKQLR
jgi:hypothetical protein